MQKLPFDHDALKKWFLEHRRPLPWRENPSPYTVWISEVMLQQTQASVVFGYFLRWMEAFPTVAALAAAPLQQVIKMWEGLGYYSRARHLHEAAQWLVCQHAGELPDSFEELIQIKGLGRYTVGAILSFAFKQRRPAVDGNVMRVLARYYAIRGSIQTKPVQDQLWVYAEKLLPKEEPWLIVEGLIELGALICKKEPRCCHCPLQASCRAFRFDLQNTLPRKGRRHPLTALVRSVFVVVCQGSILVKKGKKGRVMADLYEFPFQEEGSETRPDPLPLLSMRHVKSLASVQQHFTRFKVTLHPSLWEAEQKIDFPDYEWIDSTQLDHYPFSSGHRKILHQLKVDHAYFTY